METKHTPGPWRVAKMRAMTGPTEEMLAVEGGIETDAPERVARIGFEVTKTAEADARLIAATPELLEAAIELKDVCNRPSAARTRAEAWRKLDKAIAKALQPNQQLSGAEGVRLSARLGQAATPPNVGDTQAGR